MSANQVEVIPPRDVSHPVPQGVVVAPMQMLATAVEKGASIETIERLAALAERMEMQRAAKAFAKAFASAKANIPPIIKSRSGHNGKYADFNDVASAVDPILSAHGLFYKHRTVQQPSGDILVVCELWHEDGHREENSLAAKPDTSGNKNSIQAIGSTQTYLMRYTLLAAMGIAPSNDDDGKAGGIRSGKTINEDEAEALEAKIIAVGSTVARVCAAYKIETLADLPASKLAHCENRLLATARENGRVS